MYRVASARTLTVAGTIATGLFSMLIGSIELAARNGVSAGKIDDWSIWSALSTGSGRLWDLAVLYPPATYVVIGVLAVMVFVSFIADKVGGTVKDPQRMYTKDQRMLGANLAGGRCEMEAYWWLRCPRGGEHGDHFFPHSLGGATSMRNFVWACAKCNIAKSNHVPTIWQKIRLERRRRRYFPEGMLVDVGEKYQGP